MATLATPPVRRCSFAGKRPDRFPIYDTGCQFTGNVVEQLPNLSEELIEYKGKLWCPFHLPIDYWDENESEWHLLGRQMSDTIVELADNFRSDDAYYSLDLTGIVFPIGVRFQNLNFGSVLFGDCKFLDHVNFSNCKFNKYTHFDRAIFREDLSFFDCSFENELVLSRTHFGSRLRFSDTKTAEIRAQNASFYDSVWLSGFSINGNIDLSSTKFFRDLRFDSIDLLGELIMIEPEVQNGLSIHKCKSAHVRLAKAKLLGRVDFSGQEFSSRCLRDARFGDAQDLSMTPPHTNSRRNGPPDWASNPSLSYAPAF